MARPGGPGPAQTAPLSAAGDSTDPRPLTFTHSYAAGCNTCYISRCGDSRTAKFTPAELEEEEQSLERLRRRHRDLTARDVFGTPEAARAGERIKQCVAACEDYAERVLAALHQVPEAEQ
ncbi:Chromate resistance protein ChrB [Streptomyces sp. NPDC087437]|uniref:Chromate resistance protein ChrB n=1 Tax=Streptomyces sp. NPDC087437 TaxID=3365789 RepID=UPI0037F90A42